jgi:hypothetical protein
MGRGFGTFVLVVVGIAIAGAGGLSWRDHARLSAMDASMAARRELAATRLAPAGAAPQAGISARAPIRVQGIPDRLAKRLRDDHDFQRFSHRCGVCHGSPDPALHPAHQWDAVVGRMAANIDAAGLLPLTEADRDAVLRVLRQHARTER